MRHNDEYSWSGGKQERQRGKHLQISTHLDISSITGIGGPVVLSLGQQENCGAINRMGKSGRRVHLRGKPEFRLRHGPDSVVDITLHVATQAWRPHMYPTFCHSLSYYIIFYCDITNYPSINQWPLIVLHMFRGWDIHHDLAEWFWLRAFHEIAVKLAAEGRVISRLNWNWRIHFAAHSCCWQASAPHWLLAGGCHVGLSLRQLTVWYLASSRASDSRERAQDGRHSIL